MAAVRLRILTSFFGSILIFAVCAYAAYRGSVRLAYRHERGMLFRSLGKEEAQQLRKTAETFFAIQFFSTPDQNAEKSLQNHLESLARVRRGAPEELSPILDLQLARDYAVMALLEDQGGNLAVAGQHRQSAAAILKSLGWQDVSDNAMTALADSELRSRLKR